MMIMHIDFLTGVCDLNQLKVFSDILLATVIDPKAFTPLVILMSEKRMAAYVLSHKNVPQSERFYDNHYNSAIHS